MPQPDGAKANILVVDDQPEKVLALEAALEDLGQNVVRAYSGREALRHVLKEDFAVILLDVNMPNMDGFETAELIRRRRASADTPIIFITSFSDAMFIERGYSLGAVDYILSPPAPNILRTKVSVFVDLYRRNAEVRQQAESLFRRATQLRKLTAASLLINSALSMDKLLQAVADSARDTVGAHQATILMVPGQNWSRSLMVVSCSDQYAAWRRPPGRANGGDLHALVCRMSRPIRMTQAELEAHPLWRQADGNQDRGSLPLRGLLAAPLSGRDGTGLGIIQLSDRCEGEFSGEDEDVLVQLAQMASIAVENALFAEERETNRIKDEFLSTVSHELRTPLNAMLGWTRLLRMQEPGEEFAHGLEVIERNVKVQAKLIEDLLDLSRMTTGRLRVSVRLTALGPAVQAAVDAVRPAAGEKGIQIHVLLADEGDELSGDPRRLQQVVWNLLTNAVKFTPEGGRIDVRLRRAGTYLELQVSDTGDGIEPDFLPRIFDRFRQYDGSSTRSHGGLGIGLTIARHIVELHGGTIQVNSPGKGGGATFQVRLPASPDRVRAMAVPEEPADADPDAPSDELADLAGLCVLVVDDEPDAREVIAEVLNRAGARVMTGCCVREALEIFERQRPDVLVSDIAMPEQDGYELIRILRGLPPEKGGQVPAVALTAYASNDDRLRVLSAGYHMHLAKPVEPATLVSVVAHLAVTRQAACAGSRFPREDVQENAEGVFRLDRSARVQKK